MIIKKKKSYLSEIKHIEKIQDYEVMVKPTKKML